MIANPPDDTIRSALARARRIAVVGLSNRPERPSHDVAAYLQRAGYRIVPINPRLAGGEVLGERVYASLGELEEGVDIVDVFRRSEFIPDIIADALRIDAPLIWMQLGVAHAGSAAILRGKGRLVVQDRCLKIEHARLCR